MDAIESDFNDFFKLLKDQSYSKNDINGILSPLRKKLWIVWLKKYVGFLAVLATICFLIYSIDFFNWHFCAISRLFMIKLLPLWNWKPLYNSKCLIAKEVANKRPVEKSTKFSLQKNDCVTCEFLGENFKIERLFLN
jgi:hypothetical protein